MAEVISSLAEERKEEQGKKFVMDPPDGNGTYWR